MTLQSNPPLERSSQKGLPCLPRSRMAHPGHWRSLPARLWGGNELVFLLAVAMCNSQTDFLSRSTFFVQKLSFVMLARRFRVKSVGVQGDGCLTFGLPTCQDVVGIRLTVPEDHCRRSNEQELFWFDVVCLLFGGWTQSNLDLHLG